MKKTYLFLLIVLVSFSSKAQTTLQYAGTSTNTYFGSISKVGGIGQNNITTGTVGYHIGFVGTATNGSVGNVGILGTTPQNTVNAASYVAVYGDNFNNNITANNKTVIGGKFWAKNLGTNATITGVDAYALGNNNSSITVGVDAVADNFPNTTPNKVIAIRGITNSGQSTITNVLKDVANPGGYFSSNDGQGIYATTTDGYRVAGGIKYSRAMTGYSNVTNAWENVGMLGMAEGTGNFKIGVYGVVDGSQATSISSGIWGSDRIDASNTYAGFFDGKVYTTGKMGVGVGTISTNEQMEVNGRLRIRSNTFTAGLWFNNSANNTALTDGAFVGLRNETPGSETVGFFLNNAFRLYVDRVGNTTVGGGISVGGGQTINKIIKTNIATTINPIGAASFLTQTYTITGVAVGDNVVVNLDGIGNYIIASTRVSANDTVEVKYYNPGGASGFPTSVTMYVTAFK